MTCWKCDSYIWFNKYYGLAIMVCDNWLVIQIKSFTEKGEKLTYEE